MIPFFSFPNASLFQFRFWTFFFFTCKLSSITSSSENVTRTLLFYSILCSKHVQFSYLHAFTSHSTSLLRSPILMIWSVVMTKSPLIQHSGSMTGFHHILCFFSVIYSIYKKICESITTYCNKKQTIYQNKTWHNTNCVLWRSQQWKSVKRFLAVLRWKHWHSNSFQFQLLPKQLVKSSLFSSPFMFLQFVSNFQFIGYFFCVAFIFCISQ